MNRTALLSFFVVLIFVVVFFKPVFLHPNETILTADGDGIKTYTMIAGHIRNDSSWTEYQNMNYPYGQTHVFTDGQTLITNTLKFLAIPFPWFETHSVGISNMLWLLSFPLCAFFLSLVLLRLSLPKTLVIIAAVSITLLCPQLFRLQGHLTLSYAFCFPLSWWLLIKYDAGEKRKITDAILILLNTLWFFIHPYFSAILIAFTICYAGTLLLSRQKSFTKNKNLYLGYILQIIVPAVLTQIIISIIDFHQGRPIRPTGFFEHFATFATVFLPLKAPFHNLITKPLGFSQSHWEGWAYIGLAGTLMAAFSLFRLFRFILRKRFDRILFPVRTLWLSVSITAAIVLLIYAMAVPFRLGGEPLLNWITTLRQFRSLGRFAWVFYFVFSVFSFYTLWLIYKILRARGKTRFAFMLIGSFAGLQLLEGFSQFRIVAEQCVNAPNYFNEQVLPKEYRELRDELNRIKTSYQCLVPLPFYHIGSDNFTTADPRESLRASMVVSYWCNFPLLASSAARSPIPEAKNILQFFSPSFISKTIETDLPSKKPFLILMTQEQLDLQENYLLQKSTKIWENTSFSLFALAYDSIFETKEDLKQTNIIVFKPNITGQIFSSDPGYFYFDGFDSASNSKSRYGKGCFEGNKNIENLLIDHADLPFEPGKEYLLTYWHNNLEEGSNQIDLLMIAENPQNGEEQILFSCTPARAKVIDGEWSLVQQTFIAPEKPVNYTLKFLKDPHSDQHFFADELLIQSPGTNVYLLSQSTGNKNDSVCIVNNFQVPGYAYIRQEATSK